MTYAQSRFPELGHADAAWGTQEGGTTFVLATLAPAQVHTYVVFGPRVSEDVCIFRVQKVVAESRHRKCVVGVHPADTQALGTYR